MNKTVNRQKAGLIMYHESGDELHWLVVTPEFYQKVKDLIESVPNEKWTNEVDFNMFRNVFDMFYYPEDEVGRGGLYVPEIIEHDFTQT